MAEKSPNGLLYVNGADKVFVYYPDGQLAATYVVEYGTNPVTFDKDGNAYIVSTTLDKVSTLTVWDPKHQLKYRYSIYDGGMGETPLVTANGVVYLGGNRLFAVKLP
ncbi:hypothetical protein [Neobacillus sp. D3-1R]|uniref:hypothetical protein n=1 Tax=Neobacillus sp. D3-1R TaxID=3445778 RepID=UPI003F9FE6BE